MPMTKARARRYRRSLKRQATKSRPWGPDGAPSPEAVTVTWPKGMGEAWLEYQATQRAAGLAVPNRHVPVALRGQAAHDHWYVGQGRGRQLRTRAEALAQAGA